MANTKTKIMVGFFVAAGLSISVLALILLGMNQIFRSGHRYQVFFNESVQGLNIDAPVKFRGVPVGRVESIDLAPDGILIQVILNIDNKIRFRENAAAQLSAVGITGAMFVELDLVDDNQALFRPPVAMELEYDYPVLPSRPSSIQKFLSGIDDLYKKISSIDISGISERTIRLLDHADQAVSNLEVEKISNEIEASAQSMRELLQDERWSAILDSADKAGQSADILLTELHKSAQAVQKLVDHATDIVLSNKSVINETLLDLRTSAQRSEGLMAQGNEILLQGRQNLSSMESSILITVQNLERSTEILTRLLQKIEAQPSRLLFSPPLPPRKISP